jgi:UDP-2,3-diacylglucosamine hydrolase
LKSVLSKEKKRVYFASDIHLGSGGFKKSIERERRVVRWLDEIKHDAQALYLVGDVFDFWHEWDRAAPQGFTRFLGKLAELSDAGVKIHYFTGNHDIWVYKYLKKEIGLELYRKELKTKIFGKSFYIAHGDGLGPGDRGYKLLKLIFTNKFLQWCFKNLLHPDFALWIGQTWSNSRRMSERDPVFYEDNEWLVMHSKEELKKEHFDYFVYGHRHLPGIFPIAENVQYINLGDWLGNYTYGVFDGENFELKKFE